MRVLILNTHNTGSTGKIAYGFYRKLIEHGHDAFFAFGFGDDRGDNNLKRITPTIEPKIHFRYNLFTGYHGCFQCGSFNKLKKAVEEFKPDIIQLYNLHGYYIDIEKTLKYLAGLKIPVVYGMLDEYPYLGYCCYAYDCDGFKNGCQDCKKKFADRYLRSLIFNRAKRTNEIKENAYDRFKDLVFTGPEWVIERAKSSSLLKNRRLEIVDEYVDNKSTFTFRDTEKKRADLGIAQDSIVLLDVAPSYDDRKGVVFFVELARRVEKTHTEYKFINVGYSGDFDPLPTNMIGVPYVNDQDELAEYYSMADLFVCTSLADTMPNTCLESLSCGTPIIGFECTGIPYVAEEPMGRFVEKGNMDMMEEIVVKTGRKTSEMRDKCRKYAIERYSPEAYYDAQMRIYDSLLE